MTTARQRSLCGHVLAVRNFGDGHRIYEVLTAEEGRVSLVARHARASRRRLNGALDVFATAELDLCTTNGLWRLEQARVTAPRLGLRDELERLERAALLCEAVRVLVPEHHAAPETSRALARALDDLAFGHLAAAVSCYATLMGAAGILPDLARCTRCGAEPQAVTRLDGQSGGVLCQACAPHSPTLDAAALAALCGRPCADPQTALVAEGYALDWIEAQIGRALQSRNGWAGRASVP